MIPRHSLPFGAVKILSSLVSSTPVLGSADLEKAYADALGVSAVILLPSVRAGIHMAIQATNGPDMIVAGPAYTCDTVHDALALSGARTRLVDLAPDSFLMPPKEVSAVTEPGCALVLSEVYGIPYDQEMLQDVYRKGLRVRILDMAMSIPVRKECSDWRPGILRCSALGGANPCMRVGEVSRAFKIPSLQGESARYETDGAPRNHSVLGYGAAVRSCFGLQ